MRKNCGYHKSYDELCKKWCVKIIFTNYNFTEIEICGETNFPKKEKTAVVGNRAPAALLARAPISQPRSAPTAAQVKMTMLTSDFSF